MLKCICTPTYFVAANLLNPHKIICCFYTIPFGCDSHDAPSSLNKCDTIHSIRLGLLRKCNSSPQASIGSAQLLSLLSDSPRMHQFAQGQLWFDMLFALSLLGSSLAWFSVLRSGVPSAHYRGSLTSLVLSLSRSCSVVNLYIV